MARTAVDVNATTRNVVVRPFTAQEETDKDAVEAAAATVATARAQRLARRAAARARIIARAQNADGLGAVAQAIIEALDLDAPDVS
jgi:hypothetical protein